ncbi:MAG: prolyl oligopeptidase family serine peptidase [Planctomycetes bacterium]|nr:prolyl oligopeptidase family serine peptidase [Planctomycetota bacterium]
MKPLVVPLAAMAAILAASTSFGQGLATRPVVSAVACPAEVITAATRDQREVKAVVRKPPGKGPFPAAVTVHAGLFSAPLETLVRDALDAPGAATDSRFLAAGYVMVSPTLRSRTHDPLTTDALVDLLGVIEHVKKMPEVDPRSVVLFGGSGSGSLVLEAAGETNVCAAIAGEPATVLFTGMYSSENLGGGPPFTPGSGKPILEDPHKFYTSEVRQKTRAKINKIACPVLILHGDQHILKKINHEIFIPELKAAGKDVQVIVYPGEPHGFYWGREGSPEAAQKCFDDCQAFLKPLLKTQPTPLDESLVKRVPAKQQSALGR